MRIIAALALLVASSPVIAADEAAAPAAQEKKICRAPVNTGSRLSKARVCKTKAEWEAARLAQQRDMEQRGRSDLLNWDKTGAEAR